MDFDRYSAACVRLDQMVGVQQQPDTSSTSENTRIYNWISTDQDARYHSLQSAAAFNGTKSSVFFGDNVELRKQAQQQYLLGYITATIVHPPFSLASQQELERRFLTRNVVGGSNFPLAPRFREEEGQYVNPYPDVRPWQLFKMETRLAREDPKLQYFFTADGLLNLAPEVLGRGDVRSFALLDEMLDMDDRTNCLILPLEAQDALPSYKTLHVFIPYITLSRHECVTEEDVLSQQLLTDYTEYQKLNSEELVQEMDTAIIRLQQYIGETLLNIEQNMTRMHYLEQQDMVGKTAADLLGEQSQVRLELEMIRGENIYLQKKSIDLQLKLRLARLNRDEASKKKQEQFVKMYDIWQKIKQYRGNMPVMQEGDTNTPYQGTNVQLKVRKVAAEPSEGDAWKADEAGELAEAAKQCELRALLYDLEHPQKQPIKYTQQFYDWGQRKVIEALQRKGQTENVKILAAMKATGEQWISEVTASICAHLLVSSSDQVEQDTPNLNFPSELPELNSEGIHIVCRIEEAAELLINATKLNRAIAADIAARAKRRAFDANEEFGRIRNRMFKCRKSPGKPTYIPVVEDNGTPVNTTLCDPTEQQRRTELTQNSYYVELRMNGKLVTKSKPVQLSFPTYQLAVEQNAEIHITNFPKSLSLIIRRNQIIGSQLITEVLLPLPGYASTSYLQMRSFQSSVRYNSVWMYRRDMPVQNQGIDMENKEQTDIMYSLSESRPFYEGSVPFCVHWIHENAKQDKSQGQDIGGSNIADYPGAKGRTEDPNHPYYSNLQNEALDTNTDSVQFSAYDIHPESYLIQPHYSAESRRQKALLQRHYRRQDGRGISETVPLEESEVSTVAGKKHTLWGSMQSKLGFGGIQSVQQVASRLASADDGALSVVHQRSKLDDMSNIHQQKEIEKDELLSLGALLLHEEERSLRASLQATEHPSEPGQVLENLAVLLTGDAMHASRLDTAETYTKRQVDITDVRQVVREYIDPDFQPLAILIDKLLQPARPLFVYRRDAVGKANADTSVLAQQIVRGVHLPIRTDVIKAIRGQAQQHQESQQVWAGNHNSSSTVSDYYSLHGDANANQQNTIVRVKCGPITRFSLPSPGANPQWGFTTQIPIDLNVEENLLIVTVFDFLVANRKPQLMFLGEFSMDVNALKHMADFNVDKKNVSLLAPLKIPTIHTETTAIVPNLVPKIEVFACLTPPVLVPPQDFPPEHVLTKEAVEVLKKCKDLGLKYDKKRHYFPFVKDHVGTHHLICDYLKPLEPPKVCQAHPKLFNRLVQLNTLPNPEDDVCMPILESFMLGGDTNESAISLACFFLWWDLKSNQSGIKQSTYIGVGVRAEGGHCLFVCRIYGSGTSSDSTGGKGNKNVTFHVHDQVWNPNTGTDSPISKVLMLIDQYSIYANIQDVLDPNQMAYSIEDTSSWQSLYTAKNLGAVFEEGTYLQEMFSQPTTHWNVAHIFETHLLKKLSTVTDVIPRVDYGASGVLRQCLAECESISIGLSGTSSALQQGIQMQKGAYKKTRGYTLDIPIHLSMIDEDDLVIDITNDFNSEDTKNIDGLTYAVATSPAIQNRIWKKVKSTLIHMLVQEQSKLALAVHINAYTKYNAVVWVFIAIMDEY